MTLSLKLQKPNSSLAESMEWVHGTMDIIEDMKIRYRNLHLKYMYYLYVNITQTLVLLYKNVNLCLQGFYSSKRSPGNRGI